MATDESPEKHSWWLNELESLGVNTREESQLKDPNRTTKLTKDIKQMFYEEYKKSFGLIYYSILQFFTTLKWQG
jgi:hypothetical protein